MNSITKRWVRGSLFFTLAVLLAAEMLFLFFMISGYRNSVRDAIVKQLNNLQGQLSSSTSASPQAKELELRRIVEKFESKDKFELMLVDTNGNVVATSSGVLPAQKTVAEDIQLALRPGVMELGEYAGKNGNGENIMAITMRTPYSSGGIVAMRLVTSLELVNKSMRDMVIISVLFMMVVILASVVSGLFFIRSIVLPLHKVEATAARIAEGDFDTRIDNKSDDEIGSLCKTINDMAQALSQTERVKNEFISSVSHELRTPLTSIKGWTETISHMPNPQDPNFRRGVEIIAGETNRLYDMVEELLDFSRMQNGLVLQLEKLDLAAEVEEAVLISGQRAATLGVALCYEAPEMPIAVLADKNRVRQVLLNVLDNAIKYSYKNGKICLDVVCEGGSALVAIADEGQGIDREDLDNVKTKFYKGKGSARGSGIGLAVVDEIMRAHGGKFEIRSKLREGTTVILSLPLADQAPHLAPLDS